MLRRVRLFALVAFFALGEAATAQSGPTGGAGSSVDGRTDAIVVTGQTERSMLERYVGRYALNGTIVTVELTDDNQLTVYRTGERPGRPWRMLSANSFESSSPPVRIFFEGEGPKATIIRSQYLGQEVVGARIDDADRAGDAR